MSDKILVVDTNEDLLQSIQQLLELYKFEVDLAFSGKDALEKITLYNYDVVLSDIHLPDFNGLELLERIKFTINSEIPVILMTGMITIDIAVKSINLGAADFIKKPFNDSQIYKAILRQISKRKKDSYFNNYTRYLLGTNYSFEFTANDYIEFNITDFLVSHLIKLKEITPAVCNELSLCIEEMLSNAFIHGTFLIASSYKQMDHDEYNDLINQLLKDSEIKNKRVSVNISYRKKAKVVLITVTDQGNGFDFKSHDLEDEKNIFRGLSLIKIIADNVQFFNEGRTIRIEKKIGRKQKRALTVTQE
ncbi:MAG: response regulator [Candidatus Cloacimonetes bacterium]|nr:response regulator [Candidatus Cloacimonadota bacterium]